MAENLSSLSDKNQKKLNSFLPNELWILIDDEWLDAVSHSVLRSSCSFFKKELKREKEIEFKEYFKLFSIVNNDMTTRTTSNNDKGDKPDTPLARNLKIAFQESVHLKKSIITQRHFDFLCLNHADLEIMRICKMAILPPFSLAHIDISEGFPLQIACSSGNVEFLELLLKDPQNDPVGGQDLIRTAISFANPRILEALLRDGRVKPQFYHLTEAACWKKHAEICQILLAVPSILKEYLEYVPHSSEAHIELPEGVIVPDLPPSSKSPTNPSKPVRRGSL